MAKTIIPEQDLVQIRKKQIHPEQIFRQIDNFKQGFPFMKLLDPAVPENGILCINDKQQDRYIKIFNSSLTHKKLVKFVPASGAASRMFKSLFEYLEESSGYGKSIEDYPEATGIIKDLDRLAMKTDLEEEVRRSGGSLESMIGQKKFPEIIGMILGLPGLDYGSLPKALLKFHKYPDENRTAMEEHLVEGAHYCKGFEDIVNIHFTVSPEHLSGFKELLKKRQSVYEERFAVQYKISFSIQKSSTDTIAVDSGNQPFREEDGSILFRPGGHGALLSNLNDLEADIVFIKNIDNVAPDRVKHITYRYKKLLAGILLDYQARIFEILNQLEVSDFSHELLKESLAFLEEKLHVRNERAHGLNNLQKAEYIHAKLNRPIRVCGMVKNEGEPGGGPFWSVNQDGSVSLQIVEASQIDLQDEKMQEIVGRSTHFNPVDLVCGIRDYKGNKFDLLAFVDPSTGFISKKSRNGRELKAQELPGLWNGAMSDWNTLFVETPIETFSPVKTINDLLRPEHIA